jgi:nicotinate-nucleotide adenylyltransferase
MNNPGCIMKIGIFGGSFNPPHIAHLILADSLYENLSLDKVIFMPSSTPPHKQNDTLLDPADRLRLVKLAIAGNDRFSVSDLEIKRGGTSYTVETISALEKIFKNAKLYLIVGLDNLITFHHWREYRAILDRCTVVAMNRPGTAIKHVPKEILEKTTIVEVPYLDISSTAIRERIRHGKSVRYLVPDAVLEEIKKCGFYL